MHSDPRFLEAWVNRTDHRVLGLRLHPLCFLDLLALDAVSSPFLPGAAKDDLPEFATSVATGTDFLIAAHICSRRIKSLELDPADLVPRLAMKLWANIANLQRENAALQAYFDDYFSTLEMWRADRAGRTCNAPWILSLVSFLLRHTTLTEWRIWTAPVGQMLCYASAIEEQVSDGSQVISLEELQMMSEASDPSSVLRPPSSAAAPDHAQG